MSSLRLSQQRNSEWWSGSGMVLSMCAYFLKFEKSYVKLKQIILFDAYFWDQSGAIILVVFKFRNMERRLFCALSNKSIYEDNWWSLSLRWSKCPNWNSWFPINRNQLVSCWSETLFNVDCLEVTTVESVLQRVSANLSSEQDRRRELDPESAQKIDEFINRIERFLALEEKWTLVSIWFFLSFCFYGEQHCIFSNFISHWFEAEPLVKIILVVIRDNFLDNPIFNYNLGLFFKS